MILLATVLLGTISLRRLEVTLLPEVKSDHLGVWIAWRGAAVPEIEEAVARPAEETLLAAPGVRGVETRVRTGGASFRIGLQPGRDPELVALAVRERLDAIRWTFPEGVERPVVLGETGEDAPAMVLALAQDDLVAATNWAERVLSPRLEQIDGVARALVIGGVSREIRIEPDPERLEATGLGVAEIAAAVRDANVDSPGGVLRRRGTRFSLQVETRLRDGNDVRDVVLPSDSDRSVRLGDLARVVDGVAEPEGWSRLDGRPAVGVLLYREAEENLLDLTEAVRKEIDRLTEEFDGLALAVVADSSPFVRQSVAGVSQAMGWGGLLAFGVLLLFLGDPRAPLHLLLALPVSVIATFCLFDGLGVSLNLMSLGGLALGIGMLVDNGIVCLENIHRHRSAGRSPAEAATLGAKEISLPVLASTLTTCAVFVPLVSVPGVIGDLFRDQAIAVSVSLLVSLVVALTLLPLLSAKWPSRRTSLERRPLFGLYHAVLEWGLSRPGRLLGIVAVTLVVSGAGLALRPRELLPPVATDHLELILRLPPGSDVLATDRAVRDLEAWLASRDEVASVFATVGNAGTIDPGDEARSVHRAVLRLVLSERGRARRELLLSDLRGEFGTRPGWSLGMGDDTPELAAVVRGGAATLTGAVTGPDPRRAERIARAVTGIAADRLGDEGHPFRLEAAEMQPRLRLVPRAEALWRYGLTEPELLPGVEALASGHEAARIRRFDEEIPVVLRMPGETDPSSAVIVARGRSFPVRELFETTTELAAASVRRVDQARVASIRWDGPLREAGRAREALESAVCEIGLPPGYAITFGGAWREMREILEGIARAFALSAGLVLLILAVQFESVRLPFVIFAAVPLALVGVAAALLLTGGTVNALSGIGIVVLVGIVVNDAILKVDLLSRLRRSGVPRSEAVSVAGRRRYRPILMTTLTTALGLLPLFFGRGAALRAPMAAALIGGLVSATVLTLVVVPVLFDRVAGESFAARPGSRPTEPQLVPGVATTEGGP
jgi:HAE1 family hydrophobic/amphiphilic exporter-1